MLGGKPTVSSIKRNFTSMIAQLETITAESNRIEAEALARAAAHAEEARQASVFASNLRKLVGDADAGQ